MVQKRNLNCSKRLNVQPHMQEDMRLVLGVRVVRLSTAVTESICLSSSPVNLIALLFIDYLKYSD